MMMNTGNTLLPNAAYSHEDNLTGRPQALSFPLFLPMPIPLSEGGMLDNINIR